MKNKPKKAVLLKIFINIIKSSSNIDIKEFFWLYYNEKYSKKKDNLLRNEFRLLNKLVENFIIDIQIEKQKKENYYFIQKQYLSFLLDRNALVLFEKEITKVFKKIDDKDDYFDFYIFFELWTRFQNVKFSYDSHYFSHAKDFYQKGILKWFKEVSFKTRKLELFNSFIERTNLQLNKNIEITDLIQFIDISKIQNSSYKNFIEKKILAFKSYDKKKLEVLIESLELLKSVTNRYVHMANEEFTLTQAIGVEYMMHADNQKAATYFKQVTDLKGEIDESFFIKGLYNYLNVEIKLNNLTNAIFLFTEYYDEISVSYLSNLFSNVISMCYILNGESSVAEKLTIIISSSVSTEDNIYSRCNLAIIYFINEDIELALNELSNINQTINYYNHSNKSHSDFISNFKSFIQLYSYKYEIKQNKRKFKNLYTDIKNHIKNSNENYSGDSLHNLWLAIEIEKII